MSASSAAAHTSVRPSVRPSIHFQNSPSRTIPRGKEREGTKQEVGGGDFQELFKGSHFFFAASIAVLQLWFGVLFLLLLLLRHRLKGVPASQAWCNNKVQYRAMISWSRFAGERLRRTFKSRNASSMRLEKPPSLNQKHKT